jgi:RNA polymerase sigma-70 factor, ECF subfamily
VLEEIHRAEWARLVAALARRFGDLDIAEEAAAEAFAAAVEHWTDGPPPNPGGWLMTTAVRRALDRLRREKRRREKYLELGREAGVVGFGHDDPGADALIDDPDALADDPDALADAGAPIDDDRLRLIFTCCHPALSRDARLALTLRLVGGLTVEEIARGLLSTEVAIGQRITRAKAKIAAAHIPYRVPSSAELPERVDTVLSVLYLVFNEGYLPGGSDPLRVDLTSEALRLTRLLSALLPDDGEVTGLLALMLMTEARRTSRISSSGELVTLAEQDRGGWDRALISEGHTLVRERIATGEPPGRFQLQAAISAVHTYAPDIRDTDWPQLSVLYAQLCALDRSPVVALNRAVVTAELDGPAVALAAVDGLQLVDYHAWHATRADLLRRLGRSAEAAGAYDAAIALAVNSAERRHLQRRRDSLAR